MVSGFTLCGWSAQSKLISLSKIHSLDVAAFAAGYYGMLYYFAADESVPYLSNIRTEMHAATLLRIVALFSMYCFALLRLLLSKNNNIIPK